MSCEMYHMELLTAGAFACSASLQPGAKVIHSEQYQAFTRCLKCWDSIAAADQRHSTISSDSLYVFSRETSHFFCFLNTSDSTCTIMHDSTPCWVRYSVEFQNLNLQQKRRTCINPPAHHKAWNTKTKRTGLNTAIWTLFHRDGNTQSCVLKQENESTLVIVPSSLSDDYVCAWPSEGMYDGPMSLFMGAL